MNFPPSVRFADIFSWRTPLDRMVWASVLVFAALALGRCWTGLPWVDEGWFFDPVYNWLTHGHTGTTVMEAKGFPWEGIERYQYWQPPFHLVVDAIGLKILGLNLFGFRALSALAGMEPRRSGRGTGCR